MRIRECWILIGVMLSCAIPPLSAGANESISPDGPLAQAIGAYNTAKGTEKFTSLKIIHSLDQRSLRDLKICVYDESLEEHIRSACLVAVGRVLGTSSDEFFIPFLAQPLKKNPDGVKDTAARTLRMKGAMEFGRSKSPKALAFLKKGLADPGWDMTARDGAAFGLAQMGDRSGVPHAIKSIISKNFTRDISLNALIVLQDKTAIPEFEKAMVGLSPYEADELRKSIVRLEMAGKNPNERLQILSKAVSRNDVQSMFREWGLVEILRLKTPEAYKAIDLFIRGGNKQLSQPASAMLSNAIMRPGEFTLAEFKAVIPENPVVKSLEAMLGTGARVAPK